MKHNEIQKWEAIVGGKVIAIDWDDWSSLPMAFDTLEDNSKQPRYLVTADEIEAIIARGKCGTAVLPKFEVKKG